MANENEGVNEDLHVVEEEEEEEENALDYHQDRMPHPTFHDSVPEERSGHVAVAHGSYMYILGGYKNAAIRGYHDFYLPREELWIYNMETGRWKKKYTEGDVPQSMSGSCAACVDGVLYLFGGHHARGNTNEFYILNLRAKDKTLHWERIKEFKGVPPTPKDKLGCWVYKNKLIFFGGYGYQPREQYHGSFEFDESSFWNASLPRGWNNHVHFIDLETFTWNQPITKGKPPSPRAAHACTTIGNRGYMFGGRYQDARTNDLYYLDLDTWEWNEVVQSPDQIPVGRSWHSLTTISNDHLFLFGGFTTDKQPLSDAWIYSVSKNEWLKVEHSYADRPSPLRPPLGWWVLVVSFSASSRNQLSENPALNILDLSLTNIHGRECNQLLMLQNHQKCKSYFKLRKRFCFDHLIYQKSIKLIRLSKFNSSKPLTKDL